MYDVANLALEHSMRQTKRPQPCLERSRRPECSREPRNIPARRIVPTGGPERSRQGWGRFVALNVPVPSWQHPSSAGTI